MHFWEDCYLVEIIDPETGEPVPDGEIGELVLTTLDREMMPLLRYRTEISPVFFPENVHVDAPTYVLTVLKDVAMICSSLRELTSSQCK